MEHFPIGQMKKISKNQKVKVWSNFDFKCKRSKNAILNGRVLGHEIYIFGKRMKNVVCRKKPHQIWPYGLRDMPLLKFKNFWKRFDHNLPTIHGNWEFLDFLEMGEQDLQLSCWAKIHLKLVSWCKFKIKKFPFLAVEITGPLAISGKFLICFKFFHDVDCHDI